MNCNLNTAKLNNCDSLTADTPRGSPQLKNSPKHRGIRVKFDKSSCNSSPKSRSSREKDEEEFRTNVAQSIGLAGGSNPLQTLSSSSKHQEETMEPHIGSSSSSLADPMRTGLPNDEIVPIEKDLPGPLYPDVNTRNLDDSKDGMSEYAAHYTESPQGFKERPLNHMDGPAQNVTAEDAQDSDVSSRRELREPDGASGTSSPSALPSKDVTRGKYPPYEQRDIQREKAEEVKSPDRMKTGAGIAEPQVKEKREDPESLSLPNDDVPDIPSTNIGVAFLVTVCFNLPFGILAIYFSLMATKSYRDGKNKQGARRARISMYISLFSIVLTVLIVMAVVLMRAMEGQAKQRRYNTKTSVSY